MRIRMHHNTFLLTVTAAAAAMAIVTAPSASAEPGGQPCANAGESTSCQRPASAEVYTAPRALPRMFPPSINPRWRGLGYSARFPKYGFDPKWQAFGYNVLFSGFQPRPSVLCVPERPVSEDLRCPTRSPSACTPLILNGTDMGGSTLYQTPGHAQITAQAGLAARQANPPQYPALVSTPTGMALSSMYQTPGNVQITARLAPASKNAAQQATYFPVSDLPRQPNRPRG